MTGSYITTDAGGRRRTFNLGRRRRVLSLRRDRPSCDPRQGRRAIPEHRRRHELGPIRSERRHKDDNGRRPRVPHASRRQRSARRHRRDGHRSWRFPRPVPRHRLCSVDFPRWRSHMADVRRPARPSATDVDRPGLEYDGRHGDSATPSTRPRSARSSFRRRKHDMEPVFPAGLRGPRRRHRGQPRAARHRVRLLFRSARTNPGDEGRRQDCRRRPSLGTRVAQRARRLADRAVQCRVGQ